MRADFPVGQISTLVRAEERRNIVIHLRMSAWPFLTNPNLSLIWSQVAALSPLLH